MNNREIGKHGEQIAAEYLTQKGYEILDENAHQRWGEIDLIAQDGETGEIVFVEVKLRKTRQFGTPEEGVDHYKLKHLVRAAERWVSKRKEETAWRVDVIGIEERGGKVQIEHWENVTMG